jgi:hypothetical protein
MPIIPSIRPIIQTNLEGAEGIVRFIIISIR